MSAVTKAGADIVLLQDGSASMWVTDVRPDRWQRSVQFIRAFAEALSWKGDRVALAIFAHLASPQTRLTKDPNARLDHPRAAALGAEVRLVKQVPDTGAMFDNTYVRDASSATS